MARLLSTCHVSYLPGTGESMGGQNIRLTALSVVQNQLWKLFTRHATMMLIILYLVYSQVSTVVSQ